MSKLKYPRICWRTWYGIDDENDRFCKECFEDYQQPYYLDRQECLEESTMTEEELDAQEESHCGKITVM